MSLIFYFAPFSTATLTELVIEELGIPCDRKLIDLKAGANKQPEYLKVNPNGKVPAIVHDGVTIWESSAITMYLGEVFGVEKGLYPAPGPRRGEAMKWIAWANVTLGEAVYRRGYNSEWVPEELRNAKAFEKANADVAELLGLLDAALADRAYLCGDQYTLADTHLNSFCDWLRHSQIDFSKFANVNAWTQRCTARPAYTAVMSRGA